MKLQDLKNIIYTNKAKVEEVIRDAGCIPVNQATKMFITDYVTDNGFAHVTVAAEVATNQYVEKEFSFKAEGKGRIYLEKFLNTAFPDKSSELNTKNILGKAFIGKMVCNDGHENLEAIDACDDVINTDDSDDDFVTTDSDDEELPFV